MSTLPQVRPARLVRALEKIGFFKDRQTGSHLILEHPDGRFVNIPMHGNRDVPPGVLRQILNRVGVSANELRKLL